MIEPKSTLPIKIKLVAIAKDEAAYLPEWIWHHLNCGADSIDIYINRTTDNSLEVLEKISKHYPQVNVFEADWIDQCGSSAAQRMQFIVYAKAFHEARMSGQFTHIVFLDIDEFWIHQQPKANLKTFIQSTAIDKVIFLEWLLDLPQEHAFGNLPSTMSGNLSVLGKCIYPINTEIDTFRLHVSLYRQKTEMVLANAAPFVADKKMPQALDKQHSMLKRCFIYHRANRSEFEYVSLTRRGRPSSQFAYKENRTGVTRKNDSFTQFSMSEQFYKNRQDALASFIEQCDLAAPIKRARSFVSARYQSAIDGLEEAVRSDYDIMRRIFAGVQDSAVSKVFKKYRRALSEANPKDAPLHLMLARQASHQNLDEAIVHIQKAFELRPEGPKIIELRDKLLKRRELDTDSPSVESAQGAAD